MLFSRALPIGVFPPLLSVPPPLNVPSDRIERDDAFPRIVLNARDVAISSLRASFRLICKRRSSSSSRSTTRRCIDPISMRGCGGSRLLPDPYSHVVGQFAGDPRRVGMYLGEERGSVCVCVCVCVCACVCVR